MKEQISLRRSENSGFLFSITDKETSRMFNVTTNDLLRLLKIFFGIIKHLYRKRKVCCECLKVMDIRVIVSSYEEGIIFEKLKQAIRTNDEQALRDLFAGSLSLFRIFINPRKTIEDFIICRDSLFGEEKKILESMLSENDSDKDEFVKWLVFNTVKPEKERNIIEQIPNESFHVQDFEMRFQLLVDYYSCFIEKPEKSHHESA